MNGVRSTFMRRGYLLTALSALLLLAASAGTASAQSVSFGATTGTVVEGVAAGSTNPRPFTVKITRSAPPQQGNDVVGTVSIVTTPADPSEAGYALALEGGGDISNVTFNINQEATLIITQGSDDDWEPEKLTVALRAGAGTSIGAPLVVTSKEAHVQPTATFSRTSVTITENSSTKLNVKVGVPTSTATTAKPDLSVLSNTIQIAVTPANAFLSAARGGVATLMVGDAAVEPVDAAKGIYAAGTIAEAAAAAPTELAIMAYDDMSGFEDPQITLAFVAKSLETDSGDIVVGPHATINIQSDEPVPTLSFSPTDVTINEGESVETVLIAEGAHGSEVMKVKLMVEGDADVSLMHGDKMLEEMDGHVYVDLGTSNSARLTAMSHESRELADGDMAYKAWKLVEGGTDGAMIGEGSWFKVDVVGSTAVPALPLIGQLLLALFLMAGGSRLYRRRQD